MKYYYKLVHTIQLNGGEPKKYTNSYKTLEAARKALSEIEYNVCMGPYDGEDVIRRDLMVTEPDKFKYCDEIDVCDVYPDVYVITYEIIKI